MEDERRQEAETRYITGGESLRALAAAMGAQEKTLAKWSREGEWVKKRRRFRERAARKAVTLAANKKAKELAKLLEASDEMETALLHAARAFAAALAEEPEKVTDGKFRSGNLRNIAESIQRAAETRMMISGILTAGEKEKLALARRKMDMEERKEAQAREQESGGLAIALAPEMEELAE